MASSTASRPGAAEDAVDGVVPSRVLEPSAGDELASALAEATRGRHVTVLRGGGTKIDWGNPPSAIDLVVSTGRLNQLVVHRHADLTATVQAGMRLRALNVALARHGQWLPVDTAFDEATIGGIVATNDAGSLRHRYGTPRDLLIGATLALADGRLVTSGGHVVKNVAGYDLGRLVSGSHGSLAAITEATFKLLPLPLATSTLVVTCADGEVAGECVTALSGSQLDPVALDVRAVFRQGRAVDGIGLLLRFASGPGAVEEQATAARRLLGGVCETRRAERSSLTLSQVTGQDETELWREQMQAPWAATGAAVRLAWMPAALPRLLARLLDIAERSRLSMVLAGRACVGAGHITIDGVGHAPADAISLLRLSGVAGNVVVLRASNEVKRRAGVWGPSPDAAASLLALKQLFDPAGILNAGRGPV